MFDLKKYLIAEEGFFSKLTGRTNPETLNSPPKTMRITDKSSIPYKIPKYDLKCKPNEPDAFKKFITMINKKGVIPKFGAELHNPRTGDNVTKYGSFLGEVFSTLSVTKEWRNLIEYMNTAVLTNTWDEPLEYDMCNRWDSDVMAYVTTTYANCDISTISCESMGQDAFFNFVEYLELILKIIIDKSLGPEYFYAGSADDIALFGIGKKH